MALFFLFIFVFFGVIIVLEKGNPFLFIEADKRIKSYIEENYPTLYDDFQVSPLSYSIKEQSYGIVVTDKRNEDLFFHITYTKHKQIEDSYQFDYLEGNNFKAIVENRLSDKLQKKLDQDSFLEEFSSYRASIKTSLDALNPNVREDLVHSRAIDTLPIYTIEATTTVKNMNAENWSKQFEKLIQKTEKISFQPIDYSLFICKKEDGNNCIQIDGVTKESLTNEDLASIFQEMLQDPKKIEDQYHITYQIITKESLIK